MKIQHLAKFLLVTITYLISPFVHGDQCALTYPDGLTNSALNGSIKFTNAGRVINNPDNVLATTRVFNNGFATTCTSANCSASGLIVPALSATFNYRSSAYNLSVNGYSTTIANNDYKEVTVNRYGELTMNAHYNTYTFKKLKVENYSIVNFTPGDYYIEDLEFKSGSVLNVIGSGTVRIYATTKAKFIEDSVINGGSSGDASKLFVYYFASGEDKIKIESGAQVTAFIYSRGKVEVKDGNNNYGFSDVYGGISAAGEIHLKHGGWVTYQGSAVANTDFGASCTSGPAIIDHYEISHDASGSTCSAETVTIKACKNADCSVLSTDLTSLDFTADGTTVNSATFTGSTTFDFTHTTVETLTLAVANTTIPPARALVCSDGSGASCDIVFSSAGCSSGNTCATTFSDAATNASSSGSIWFEDSGRLIYNPDTELATKNVTHNNSIYTTCGSGDCTASGTTVPPLTATFVANTSIEPLTVEGRTDTITHNDYQDVTVKNGGFLYMNSGFSTYRFKSLTVDYLSRVYLTAGDYYIDELEVKVGSQLNVIGSGTVRLFVKSKAVFSGLSSINDGLYGDASQLFLYYMNSSGKVQLDNAAKLTGFIYSKGGVDVTNYGVVYGAVSAEKQIFFKWNGVIIYRPYSLEHTDFGGACNSSGSVVHHYQFEYDASGLTCKTQQVEIKACANAACDALYESESTLSLVATNDDLNSVTTDLTFTKEVTVALAEILETTIKLSMNSASPSADLECYENGQLEASCDYKLEDSGFIFVNENDPHRQIPSQISGKPSNIGYNKKTITLQAVQTDTTTGACAARFKDNTEVSVNLAYQCEDPGSCKVYQCLDPNNCPSNAVKVTNNGKTNPLKEYNSYASHNLLFGNDSKATIAINYPDAGKIKLHAQMSIVLSPNKTTDMKGTSNSFVVKPFGFYMDIGMNPGATDNSGSVFNRAGEQFDMSLSAVQWQAGDDNDNNGEPDTDANLSDNPVTLNFGHETQSEQVTIATALVSPTVGNNPPLLNSNFTAFLAGRQSKVGTNGVSWGDVGVVSFTAAGDGNYIDSGDNISTTIPHVGRFVPDHFKLKSSSLTQACTSFSYMGQRVNLAINIEAQGVGDIPLLNYDSDIDSDIDNDSSNDAHFHGKSVVSLVAENNNLGVDLGNRFSDVSLNWQNGEINTTFATDFARLPVNQGMDGPYDNLFAGIKVDDGDVDAVINLTGATANMNAQNNGNCVEQDDCDAVKLHAGEVKYRYGRLASSPVFGPATSLINAPIETQYWNSKSFVPSLDDNCSTLQASEIDMSGNSQSPFANRYDVLGLTSNTKNGLFTVNTSSVDSSTTQLQSANGYFYLTLNPPIFDLDNSGYVPVTINATAYPWLQYDWGTFGKGAVDVMLPTQNVTFGQFRGNDRVIYWREKL